MVQYPHAQRQQQQAHRPHEPAVSWLALCVRSPDVHREHHRPVRPQEQGRLVRHQDPHPEYARMDWHDSGGVRPAPVPRGEPRSPHSLHRLDRTHRRTRRRTGQRRRQAGGSSVHQHHRRCPHRTTHQGQVPRPRS